MRDHRSANRAKNPPLEASAYRGFRLALCPIQSPTVSANPQPPEIFLWSGDAPGSEGKTNEEKIRIEAARGDHVVTRQQCKTLWQVQQSFVR